jgi:hypothetical protein
VPPEDWAAEGARSAGALEEVAAALVIGADPDVAHWSTYVGWGAVRFYLPLNVQLPNPFFTQAVVVAKDIAALAQGIAELDARTEEALGEKSRAHSESVTAQQAITTLTSEFREAQRKLSEIDRQLAQRTARLKLLQQLQERWEGFGEGANAVLQGRLETALNGAKASPISQGLDVKPEFGKAVEAILGSAAEAISVSDLSTAQRILAQLENEQIGSAILRITECGVRQEAAYELPAGLISATTAVSSEIEGHPALALFGSCYIADDLPAFLEFWRDNPGFAFLLGIGAPVPSSGFNKAAMAQEIEDDRLASTIYPFWKTWPVTMLNYVNHSAEQYPNIYTTGLASALFYGGAVWPFIELRVAFIDGLGRTGTLCTNTSFGSNSEGADAPSTDDSGLTLTLFDWGTVPLYNITDSTYPARTDELPGNITISAAECYTYGGTRSAKTGLLIDA